MVNVLVIVAHPDDEVLSCGASLADHALAGDQVAILFAAGTPLPPRSMEVRVREAISAMDILIGTPRLSPGGPMFTLEGREQYLSPDPEVAEDLRETIWARRADIIYTHRPSDMNRDHRAVAEAVMIATRPYATRFLLRGMKILGGVVDPFPAPSLRAGPLTVYRRVSSDAVERKLAALRAYESEKPKFADHPRTEDAVLAQMRYWGSVIGVVYAEAFEPLLEVQIVT